MFKNFAGYFNRNKMYNFPSSRSVGVLYYLPAILNLSKYVSKYVHDASIKLKSKITLNCC